MNKKAQKDLCIAIKENDLIAFQKAMTQGADISGPIENKKIEADFKELCQKHITPTATHMAILYARRKDKINILRDIQDKGVDLGPAIKEILGDADNVSDYCRANVLTFIHENYSTLYGQWEQNFNIIGAVKRANSVQLELLILWGQDVNLKDHDGRTALMYSNDLEVSKILLNAGANPNTVDNQGRTAFEHAINTICDELDIKKTGLPYDQGLNIGFFAAQYGINNDPHSAVISEKLLDSFGNIEHTEPDFVKSMTGFGECLHQARMVMAKENKRRLSTFLVKKTTEEKTSKQKKKLKF